MFERDEETAALLRQATQFLAEERGDDAVECLLKARDRMMVSNVAYPDQTWCKLPLYLSRLGRFEESMQAFDWLLNDLDRRARKQSFMDNPNVSFGRSTSKKSVYSSIVRNGKMIIERNREVALRRMRKAGG